jgi:hypothetical protein
MMKSARLTTKSAGHPRGGATQEQGVPDVTIAEPYEAGAANGQFCITKVCDEVEGHAVDLIIKLSLHELFGPAPGIATTGDLIRAPPLLGLCVRPLYAYPLPVAPLAMRRLSWSCALEPHIGCVGSTEMTRFPATATSPRKISRPGSGTLWTTGFR